MSKIGRLMENWVNSWNTKSRIVHYSIIQTPLIFLFFNPLFLGGLIFYEILLIYDKYHILFSSSMILHEDQRDKENTQFVPVFGLFQKTELPSIFVFQNRNSYKWIVSEFSLFLFLFFTINHSYLQSNLSN